MENNKKVLIIDDEPSIHKLITIILEEEGFQIVGPQAHDEARRSVKKGKPDIIILDIMMPEVDGFDVLKMLKGDTDTMHIPVIVLSVRNLKNDIDKALSLGADNYLTKPFEPAKLVEAINAALAANDIA